MLINSSLNQVYQKCVQTLKGVFRDSFLAKLSKRELQIVAIALTVFTLLGIALSQFYRWTKKAVQKPESDPTISKNLVIDLGKTAEPQGIKPVSKKIVLNPPKVNIKDLFNELLENTTECENLPFSRLSCQFSNILCPKETHVKLPGQNERVYLHANEVKFDEQHFIATQYPQQKGLFWLACKGCSLIVDLTNGSDMKRGLVSYAPPIGTLSKTDEISIECLEKHPDTESSFDLYTYRIKQGDDTKDHTTVQRLHYSKWVDHHGIDIHDLDRLTKNVKKYQVDPTQPVLFHCHAGVGRTGTAIVACRMRTLIETGKINADNLLPTLMSLILEGRRQRGPYFVQKDLQLQSLWEWSWKALEDQMNQKG